MACQYSFAVPAGIATQWPSGGLRIVGATYLDAQTGSGTYFDLTALPECFDDACVENGMETAFPAQNGTAWISDVAGGTVGGAVVVESLVSLDVTSSGSAYQLPAVEGTCFTGTTSTGSVVDPTALFTWEELVEQSYLESIITFFALFVSFWVGMMRRAR